MGLISRVSSRTYRNNGNSWYHYICSAGLFIALDITWIKYIFGKPYFKMIKEIQHTELKMRYSAGSVAYTCMLLGLLVITVPNIDASTNSTLITSCLQFGTTLGAAVYGTYAFTCASIFIDSKP